MASGLASFGTTFKLWGSIIQPDVGSTVMSRALAGLVTSLMSNCAAGQNDGASLTGQPANSSRFAVFSLFLADRLSGSCRHEWLFFSFLAKEPRYRHVEARRASPNNAFPGTNSPREIELRQGMG